MSPVADAAGATTTPDAAGLEAALRAAGVSCVVDADGRLAVLVPGPAGLDLADPELRRRALALLPAYGFTHLALELVERTPAAPARTTPGAPLPRD